MALYKCEVIDKSGNKKYLVKEASDEVSLKAYLKQDDYFLVKSKLVVEKSPNTFFSVSSKVKLREIVIFLRQFSVMVSAAISISESLNILKGQKFSKAFRKVLIQVHNDVLSGLLLSEALRKHPKVFPNFFTEMVAIGEVSGSLDTVLESMADYYERDQKIRKKAKSAMVYPCLVIGLTVIIIFFMALVILPEFEKMITDLGGEVPLITEVVLNFFGFIKTNFLFIIAGIAILVIAFILWKKTKTGRYQLDWIKLHIPFLGVVNKNLITARFARAFIILLNSGMTITDCMENLYRMLGNKVYMKKFSYSIEEVKRGKRIAKSIENTNMFPVLLTEMINVGEKSGNLTEVLESTSSYFDNNVETSITRATSILEPLMIVVLGLVVGLVILSVYLPIIAMMQNIN